MAVPPSKNKEKKSCLHCGSIYLLRLYSWFKILPAHFLFLHCGRACNHKRYANLLAYISSLTKFLLQ
ncbi:hypothetical protein AQUCO_06000076v1 [Aquilegia coerulea]|uniref:Uncharacterized protein n=1 Tax=Aquilegia coerulea TaxID=218851 RepID=A0A2G5CDW3_AQUCA|nr:hypothetical protein AQUCO_06000076v1 [Aquilegia coerulea]